MKKILLVILSLSSSYVFADIDGWYIGGGLAYATQTANFNSNDNAETTPAIRVQAGYQFADWIDTELGWNYILSTPTGIGNDTQSSTIYDFAVLPGFTLPSTPVTIFVRLGVDSMSTNLNSSWYNQFTDSARINFEYGAGIKIQIPETRTIIRGQYINFGSDNLNGSSTVNSSANALFIDASYIF